MVPGVPWRSCAARDLSKQSGLATFIRTVVGHQIAWALFNLGRKEEASTTLEQLLKDHPDDSGGLFTSVQAVLAASAGQERMAEDKIKLAMERGKGFGHFHHTAYHIACAYALMAMTIQGGKSLLCINLLRGGRRGGPTWRSAGPSEECQ